MSMRGPASAVVASLAWHSPQNSRVVGLLTMYWRGCTRCCWGASWQRVHAMYTCSDASLECAMVAWHAVHSFGVSGGTGLCGLWHAMHGLSGLCEAETICGKP